MLLCLSFSRTADPYDPSEGARQAARSSRTFVEWLEADHTDGNGSSFFFFSHGNTQCTLR